MSNNPCFDRISLVSWSDSLSSFSSSSSYRLLFVWFFPTVVNGPDDLIGCFIRLCVFMADLVFFYCLLLHLK